MTDREQHPGIVMVKPHAFRQVLDPIVADILAGGETAQQLSADDPLQSFLGRIELRSPVIRDLQSCKVGASILNIFYEDKQHRRYFPFIIEHYLGKVTFLPYIFHGNAEELPQLYDAMKGTAETYDEEGYMVSRAAGVRGLLSKPYLAVDSAALLLDDAAYRERCMPMIDNVLHVCDDRQQNEQIWQLLALEA